MIRLTQDEINAFNILAMAATNAQEQLNRTIAAQKAFISLCEIKYSAAYDDKTGQFNEERV